MLISGPEGAGLERNVGTNIEMLKLSRKNSGKQVNPESSRN